MHWAYMLICTQIYLLARVRKVLKLLSIHSSIRSYRKRRLLPVTYTNLRLSTSIDLCIRFWCFEQRCVPKYIHNSSQMQRAPHWENTKFSTKDDHCLFKYCQSIFEAKRLFVRIEDLWCEYIHSVWHKTQWCDLSNQGTFSQRNCCSLLAQWNRTNKPWGCSDLHWEKQQRNETTAIS